MRPRACTYLYFFEFSETQHSNVTLILIFTSSLITFRRSLKENIDHHAGHRNTQKNPWQSCASNPNFSLKTFRPNSPSAEYDRSPIQRGHQDARYLYKHANSQMHYNLVNGLGWLRKSTWTLFSIDYVTRWWLNQPTIWNILLVKWNIFPNFQGVKSKQTCLKPPKSEKIGGWVGGSYMDFKLVTNHHFESASSWVIQPKLETFHISRK